MKKIENFNVLESFGLSSEEKGLFAEVSELDMIDVNGGACAGGGAITCSCKFVCNGLGGLGPFCSGSN